MAENRTLAANANEQHTENTADVNLKALKPKNSLLKKALLYVGIPVLALAAATAPSPYLVERPGLVLNTLGSVAADGGEVELVQPPAEISSQAENTGALNLLTVNISGNKDHPRTWASLLGPLLDPSQDIVLVSDYYPDNVTVAEVDEESARLMDSAQTTAAAVALQELGYEVPSIVTIGGIIADTDAAKKLKAGDQILQVNGQDITDAASVIAAVQKAAGNAVTVTVIRDEKQQDISVETFKSETEDRYLMGIYPITDFEVPYEIKYGIEDIGGPSAGMMFALAVIDKAQDTDLTGGHTISGTGTISEGGLVGPIGGIKQKLYAAERAGTELFLFSAENCADLPEEIPGQMQLVAVNTLEDALTAIEQFKAGKATDGITSCTASN